jgi:hypothetical protein
VVKDVRDGWVPSVSYVALLKFHAIGLCKVRTATASSFLKYSELQIIMIDLSFPHHVLCEQRCATIDTRVVSNAVRFQSLLISYPALH